MDRLKKGLRQFRLTILFTTVVFCIMLFSMLLVFAGLFLLSKLGIVYRENQSQLQVPLLLFALISLTTGIIVSCAFSYLPLAPLRKLMNAVDRIADGDYSVRLDIRSPEEFRKLSDKFNHMAMELGNAELLHSDFINNFSHEFKTPIVSIRGFARALKWEDLSDAERNEYLDIIIEESDRLSELSSSVLNLSKIEQQTSLTDLKLLNLSEQLRLGIALLDGRLNSKNLNISFDAEEIFIKGNEEMLKQVWINLLDNAIKFSPDGGLISIQLSRSEKAVTVSVSDQGIGMSAETMQHAFDKFYQGDLSHTTKGNGIGLSLVKKIIELHGGTITLTSVLHGGSRVSVLLPLHPV